MEAEEQRRSTKSRRAISASTLYNVQRMEAEEQRGSTKSRRAISASTLYNVNLQWEWKHRGSTSRALLIPLSIDIFDVNV